MQILSIGSSSIDLFSKISDPTINTADSKLSLELGDKIPVEIKSLSLGGNAANVAAGIKRLGHSSTLYTYIGSDTLSKHIESTLRDEGIDVIAERIETTTSSLSFILSLKNDRIIFSHHNANESGFHADKVVTPPDLVFLTSVGDSWEETYEQVLSYIHTNSIPLAFSPGSRQITEKGTVFYKTLSSATLLLCNLSEAEEILHEKDISAVSPEQTIKELQSLGPKTLSITDGEHGAYANQEDQIYHIESIKTDSHERTGAGDAYAAGFLAAHLNDLDITDAMRWGSVTAHHVMRKTGAQKGLATKDEVTQYLSENSPTITEL